jgi:hypothetical protein
MVDVKRVLVFALIGVFLFSVVGAVVEDEGVGFVGSGEDIGSAAAENLRGTTAGIAAFFETLFADTIIGDEVLTRIFMAILLAMFVYTAIGSFFEENENIRWIATIAVTVLALIGLPDGFLESIRVGYGAMGAAILATIPFLIILWFTVKVNSLLMARITWLFFTLYYFALYFSNLVSGSAKGRLFYLLAGIGGVIAFFFILRVRSFIFHGKMESVKERGMQKAKKRKTLLATEMERLKADEISS